MAGSSSASLFPQWAVILLITAACGHSADAQESAGDVPAPGAAIGDLAEFERRAFESLLGLAARLRPSVAVPLLTEAAAEGSAAAMAQLGRMYLDGVGVPQDEAEAMRLMRAAAERGSVEGQSFLGRMYLDPARAEPDLAQARLWLEAAANQDDPAALLLLAGMYGAGEGVAADHAQAYELLSRAAAMGSPPALRQLGFILLRDPDRQDPARAVAILEQVADEDLDAARELGYQYLSGRSIAQDVGAAAKWFSAAAARNDLQSKLVLADLAEKGVGVERDPLRAQQLREPIIAAASPDEINFFAWRYSVSPEDVFRNGPLAVEIMERLLASADMVTTARLDTLAAAYAEAGRFEDAIAAQEAAIDRLTGAGDPDATPVATPDALLSEFRARLEGYRSGLPYRLPY